MDWFEIKNWLEMTTGLDRDSLHIYGAIGIQLLTAMIVRRPLASIWPWSAALTATLTNEYIDLSQFNSWSETPDFFRDAVLQDIWNSMLLPTVLLLLARYFPRILVSQALEIADSKEQDQDFSASE